MSDETELSWEEFVDRFKPITNPRYSGTEEKYEQGQYEFYPTDKNDMQFIGIAQKIAPECIWTQVGNEVTEIVSGFHWINTFMYYLTEVPTDEKADDYYSIDKSRWGCAHVLDDDIDLNEQEFDDDHDAELLNEGKKEDIRSRGCGWPKGAENG